MSVGHIFAGIAELMDDAVLDFRLEIDRLDRRRKTGQIIRTGNENILDAPIFRLFNTVAQNFALSFSPTHIPRTSLCPSRSMPIAI